MDTLIINKVHLFYESAFHDLLWLLGAVFVVVSLVVPYILTGRTRQKLKQYERDIKRAEHNINDLLNVVKNLVDAFKTQSAELFSSMTRHLSLNEDIHNDTFNALAVLFLDDADRKLKEQNYTSSLLSYLRYMYLMLHLQDFEAINQCLDRIETLMVFESEIRLTDVISGFLSFNGRHLQELNTNHQHQKALSRFEYISKRLNRLG